MPAASSPDPPPGPPGDLAPGTAGDDTLWPGWPVLTCPAGARAADGAARFRFRAPASRDLPQISAMWKRCSLATRMARFHAPVRDIPASYLETVLSDPCASVVAVHEHTRVVAALASLVISGGGSAELGVLVEDAWQHHGIGRHLVAHLIAAARARQITEVTASVLTQNARVADLLRHLPGEYSLTRHGTTLRVLVQLPSQVPPAPDLAASRRRR
jgi:GNAT superfamily N-acetyltransferase